jgi:hypothetical protein
MRRHGYTIAAGRRKGKNGIAAFAVSRRAGAAGKKWLEIAGMSGMMRMGQ